jgi:SAM-dependent methyltransferase
VGCSSGYLLAELHSAFPEALLVGIDLVPSGLSKAHELVPDALLLRADATSLPLPAQSVDAVVSANLLEHVPDDAAALREMHRLLRPGGLAVLVVPHGPALFDYYDAHLGHERRYARGELADKAVSAGFEVLRETAIGALLYPAFWGRKKLNRWAGRSLSPEGRADQVRRDITATSHSRVGALVCEIERRALDRGVTFRAGIRRLLVARRATSSAQ